MINKRDESENISKKVFFVKLCRLPFKDLTEKRRGVQKMNSRACASTHPPPSPHAPRILYFRKCRAKPKTKKKRFLMIGGCLSGCCE